MKLMESLLPYDVALLPDEKLKMQAINTSKELSNFGTLFTLGGNGPFPHISIYMLQLKVADLEEAEARLEEIAKQFSSFSLSVRRYFEVEKYVDVEYKKTAELEALQKKVLESFNPLRSGMRKNDAQRMATATGIAKENLEKYGTRYVYELFRPHLTFTRLKEEVPKVLEHLRDAANFSGSFNQIGLFEVGENGTCVHKIISIPL